MKWWVLVGLALAGVLASCAGLDAHQKAVALEAVNAMFADGHITAAQANEMRQAIALAAQGVTWTDVGAWIGGVVTTVGASILGVQRLRGPAKPMQQEEALALRELVELAPRLRELVGTR